MEVSQDGLFGRFLHDNPKGDVFLGDKTTLPPTFAEVDLNYYLTYVREESASVMENVKFSSKDNSAPQRKTVLVITSDSIGNDEGGVGRELMGEFLNVMRLSRKKPGVVILMNRGVKLAEGSTASFLLSELEKQGVKIMVCMTSAERHGVAHDLSAGFLVLMEDVLKEIMNAGKIITL